MSRTAAITARPSSVPVWDKVTFTGNWRRPLPPAQARWGHHAVLVYNFVPIESRTPTPGGCEVAVPVRRVDRPDRLRHQHLDGLAE